MKGKRHRSQAFAVGAVQRRERTERGRAPARRPRRRARRASTTRSRRCARGTGARRARRRRRASGRAGWSRSCARRRRAAACSTIACDPYEATTPYRPFWWLLHDCSASPRRTPEADIAERLARVVVERAPRSCCRGSRCSGAVRPRPARHARDRGARRPSSGEPRSTRSSRSSTRVLPSRRARVRGRPLDGRGSAAAAPHLVENARRPPWLAVRDAPRRRDAGSSRPSRPRPHAAPRPLTDEQAAAALIAATEDAPLRPARGRDARRRGRRATRCSSPSCSPPRWPAASTTLPDSIDAVITAQIDRLPAIERRLLRYAAVLGHALHRGECSRGCSPTMLDAARRGDLAQPRRASSSSSAGDVCASGTRCCATPRTRSSVPAPPRAARPGRRERSSARPGSSPRPKPSSSRCTSSTPSASRRRGATRGRPATRPAKYANVEAAEFYGRALVAVKRSGCRPRAGRVTEALGDVRRRVGEYKEAAVAYRAARGERMATRPRRRPLLHKEAWIPDRTGRYSEAHPMDPPRAEDPGGRRGRGGSESRARLTVLYGAMRRAQGTMAEAMTWCERSIELAEAHGGAGRAGSGARRARLRVGGPRSAREAREHVPRARSDLSGTRRPQPLKPWFTTTSAHPRTRRAAGTRPSSCTRRPGTPAAVRGPGGRGARAPTTSANPFRSGPPGRGAGALQRGPPCVPVGREHRGYRRSRSETSGGWPIGRVGATRRSVLLETARDMFAKVGDTGQVLETDARDRRVPRDERGRARAHYGLPTPRSSVPWHPTSSCNRPLLSTVCAGWALLQGGELVGAREAFDESLRFGREIGADFEVAVDDHGAPRAWTSSRGKTQTSELQGESRAIYERLGVTSVPVVPLAGAAQPRVSRRGRLQPAPSSKGGSGRSARQTDLRVALEEQDELEIGLAGLAVQARSTR